MDDARIVDQGVALLARLEHATLELVEVMDRVELVTHEPHLQRAIIQAAEEAGVIEREGRIVRPVAHTVVRFSGGGIRVKEGSFTCRRCGASLGTGYFIDLEGDELGPFGSTCIRKVTGRDPD